MRFLGADRGRVFLRLAAAAILAASWTGGAAGAEPEVIKGTVATVRPSALYLTDVGASDDEAPPRDAMVALDDDTEYYDAARRVTRDDLAPGLKVIVRFKGDGRTAAQVRIIGGKAP